MRWTNMADKRPPIDTHVLLCVPDFKGPCSGYALGYIRQEGEKDTITFACLKVLGEHSHNPEEDVYWMPMPQKPWRWRYSHGSRTL